MDGTDRNKTGSGINKPATDKQKQRVSEIVNKLKESKNTKDFNMKLVELGLGRLRLRKETDGFKLECLSKANKHMIVYRNEKLVEILRYVAWHGDSVLMYF